MSEQGNTLLHALTPNLGQSAKSVAVKRYSAQMKSMGTFGDEALQEALASESKVSAEKHKLEVPPARPHNAYSVGIAATADLRAAKFSW